MNEPTAWLWLPRVLSVIKEGVQGGVPIPITYKNLGQIPITYKIFGQIPITYKTEFLAKTYYLLPIKPSFLLIPITYYL